MTDLEITKLCAEAMGIQISKPAGYREFVQDNPPLYATGAVNGSIYYEPLHDDAQAMALVKRFDLNFEKFPGSAWEVSRWSGSEWSEELFSDDLNRAICECVANMQKVK